MKSAASTSTEMADDIGDGVEWLQWLLTNDLEAVGGHRSSDMVLVVQPAVIFCATNGGWMLSVNRGQNRRYLRTTDRFTIRIRRKNTAAQIY